MKAYDAKQLVAISRYQNYFQSLPEENREEVYARISELMEEEKEYCDKGNYKHMAQILTSIALYEVLQKHGKARKRPIGLSPKRCGSFSIPPACRSWRRRASSCR